MVLYYKKLKFSSKNINSLKNYHDYYDWILIWLSELSSTSIDADIKGWGERTILVVESSGRGRGGVQTPSCGQGLGHLSGLAKLECAGLLGDNGALVLGLQLGDQLGLQTAGLLGVQVTHLLGDINKRGQHLVVAFLLPLLERASGTADLNGQLLTAGVSNKLAGLLLNVLGGTG